MSRFVVKPARGKMPAVGDGVAGLERLDDTGLFVADARDPREVVEQSAEIAWAAPTEGDQQNESYPTGEVSIRLISAMEPRELESFVKAHGLELRRHNEFIPEQIVAAPTEPRGTWLPDIIERLNREDVVVKAWPNTLSRYRRA